MGPRGWLRAALAGALLAAGLGGCTASKETREAADRLKTELSRPAWASGVEVTSGRGGDMGEYVAIAVVLGATATPIDLVGFVTIAREAATRAGVGSSVEQRLAFELPGGGRADVIAGEAVSEPTLQVGFADWFAATQALPGARVDMRILTEGEPTGTVDLGPTSRTGVADAARALEPLVESQAGWTIRGVANGLALELAGYALPRGSQVSAFDGLVDAAASLPVDLPATSIRLSILRDRAVGDLVFAVPDQVTADDLSVASYGDRLLPVFAAQVDALRALPEPCTYVVSWAPRDEPTAATILASVLTDRDVTDNDDESTRWSRAVKALVGG